jgi:hypothetical protein
MFLLPSRPNLVNTPVIFLYVKKTNITPADEASSSGAAKNGLAVSVQSLQG